MVLKLVSIGVLALTQSFVPLVSNVAYDSGCLEIVNSDYPAPPNGECQTLTCTKVREDESWTDLNGDTIRQPSEVIKTPVYECNGRIGNYDVQTQYPSGTKVITRPGSKNPSQFDFFCWQKAGCPVDGCAKYNDVNSPGQYVWYCASASAGPYGTQYDEGQKQRATKLDDQCEIANTTDVE